MKKVRQWKLKTCEEGEGDMRTVKESGRPSRGLEKRVMKTVRTRSMKRSLSCSPEFIWGQVEADAETRGRW